MLLQAFHGRLSPAAVRLRFHGYLRELPDDLAHRFCSVDGLLRVAFVAVTGNPERIVGVGRYDRIGTEVAEVALVVEDAYQNQGIGTRLLNRLISSAREGSVRRFLALVLRGNNPMRRLLEKTACPLHMEHARDADTIWLELS